MRTLGDRIKEILVYTAPEMVQWKLGLLIEDQVAAEREACAKIVETWHGPREMVELIAKEIRNRNNSPKNES